mgnify:FL=1
MVGVCDSCGIGGTCTEFGYCSCERGWTGRRCDGNLIRNYIQLGILNMDFRAGDIMRKPNQSKYAKSIVLCNWLY